MLPSFMTEDYHGIVGATPLPRTLTTLLNNSRGTSDGGKSARTPQRIAASAAYELLRVGANLCMDHGMARCYSIILIVAQFISIPR